VREKMKTISKQDFEENVIEIPLKLFRQDREKAEALCQYLHEEKN